jgi:hypothetical protein
VFVDSRLYSLVSVIRTMETLLGLPLMNNNDAFSSMTSDEFTRAGEQGTFVVDYRNQENGLSRTTNDCECKDCGCEDCEREDCECKDCECQDCEYEDCECEGCECEDGIGGEGVGEDGLSSCGPCGCPQADR